MEEPPVSIRVFPGELRPVYYTTVLGFRSTSTSDIIRLSLEKLQIFEDKTLYELFKGRVDDPREEWTLLTDEDHPVAIQEQWKQEQLKGSIEMRLYLERKQHASLVLADFVSQHISPELDEGRIEDMCQLEELSESTMLANLRVRFSHKHIYTYVGSILISVNPYYYYSIYNPKYTHLYQGKAFNDVPPHIFAIADNAYNSMLNDRQNQSVIISGESGAGKTESTKFLLHHLMSLSAKLDESQSLELITLGTGPVLEAFGNARTVANDNSSRFGKFILVKFKENGAYYGASIEKYLLEKSRIISQAPEERNYHVFYYLLVGADAALKKQLKLLEPHHYSYLAQELADYSLAPPNGAEEYHRLKQSLSMLMFSTTTQMRMFTVLSSILHIGNIKFRKSESEETLQIENMDTISIISSLLQVEESTLQLALTTRKSRPGGTDFFVTPYRLEEAIATRDSLAKALYGALFDWIVDQVNYSLASNEPRGSHKGHSIGVLDIFGFEVFQVNSFEQFCINYANEQLQQYFNKHIFKLEQAEYEAEGIEWSSVTFIDNQECLDLIARKPTGLLPLLDEECSFPGANDSTLFQKFERQHKSHPNYRSPQMKLKEPQFTVLHYASAVTYSITGFREKNRDLMRQDIVQVLKSSHMDLVRALIGLPTYAVHRWHMAYLKISAAFAFRRAGKEYRAKLDGRLSTNLPFHFIHGSSPALIFNEPDGAKFGDGSRNFSESYTSQLIVTDKPSEEAFPLEHGRLRVGHGLRTSRSYDLLSKATAGGEEEEEEGGGRGKKEVKRQCSAEEKQKEQYDISMQVKARSMPYGISPRFARKFPGTSSTGSLKDVPASKVFSIKFPPKKSLQLATGKTKPRALSSSSSSSSSSIPSAHSPVSEKQSLESTDGGKGGGGGGGKGVLSPKEVTSPPAVLQKEESRSRLPSLSGIQERLRKHFPRGLRSRGNVGERERKNSKHSRPRSAPRIRAPGAVTDPRLLSSFARASSNRHRGPSKTVSAQFQVSLISLMERLEKTNPFFVRCLKSNNLKAPCQFDDDLVLRQLRYTGMVETVKIRKSGYSVRTSLEDFYEKYQFLMGARSSNLASQVDSFLDGLGFSSEDYQIGTTKVFMRDKHKQALQKELGDKVLARIVVIQRWVRAKMMKCRFLHMRRCAIIIQTTVRGWLARRRVNTLRKRVCSAVLVQSALRGYLARKEFILLKQAAIILQAHWKGRSARIRYVELLEEERKRQAAEVERRRLAEEAEEAARRERERAEQERKERERAEEEERLKALRLKEEEERMRLLEEEAREQEDALKLQEEQQRVLNRFEEILLSVEQKRESTGAFMDEEVSDVLFQFDSMVTELEKETIKARSLSASPLIRDEDTTSQQNELVISQNSELTTSSESNKQLSGKDFSGSSVEEKGVDSQTKSETPLENGILGSESSRPVAAAIEPELRVLVKPMVRNLKERFQTSPDLIQRSTSPLKEENLPKKAGNVQHLIAQMLMTRSHSPEDTITSSTSSSFSSSTEEKRHTLVSSSEESSNSSSGHVKELIAQMLAPRTPSPKESSSSTLQSTTDEEAGKKRQKQAVINSKIAELFDDKSTERRESRTYTPPLVRRKIQSPFLARAKSQDEEPSQSIPPRPHSACSDHNTRIDLIKKRLSVPYLIEDRTPYPEPKVEDSDASTTVNGKDRTTLDVGESTQGRIEQLSPFEVAELTTSPVFPLAQKESRETLSPVDDTTAIVEGKPSQTATEVASEEQPTSDSTEVHTTLANSLSPKKEEDTETPRTDIGDFSKTQSPKKGVKKTSPKRSSKRHRQDTAHTEVLEVSAEQAQHDIRGNCMFSPQIVDEPETIQLGGEEITLTPKRDRVSSLTRSSTRKVSDTIELNSIEISVKETKEKAAKAKLSVHESPQRKKSSDYDMLLPLPTPGKKSDYDRLLPLPPKKSDYDHLSPLQPQDELGRFRNRSASDVTSHRVKIKYIDSEEDLLAASEQVMTREKSPVDFSSLSRRKKVISLADPVAMMRGSLDESSEFTRCLTPEEIVHLNKHRQMPPSPTDRLRLFSFTKRRLRLPFLSGRRKEKEREKYVASPDADHSSTPSTPLSRRKRMTPPSLNTASHDGMKRHSKFPSGVAEQLLAHNLKSLSASRLSSCEVCHKPFTGFLRQALKCVDCEVMLHRHCEERAPHCKAKIESGTYVTMSRKKVVQKLEDLDDLGQFLLEKIGVLSKNSSTNSVIDKVFRLSLHEFHVSLISSYSLSIQSSTELPKDKNKATGQHSADEPTVSITFAQLVSRFSNIFTGIAKREGLTDPCVLSIGINQIKSFLDEFCKSRPTKRSTNINPSALKRKTQSGREIQPKVHKGHRFLPQQVKVHTVCELCSKQIPLLANGEVCEVCGYICHDTCFKKTSKKCEGRARSKSIQEPTKPVLNTKSNFGVPLHQLLPPATVKVPIFLETCLQYIEQKGLYTQGIYRKSAGSSSKKAVRSVLDEDPEHADLERFNVHAVASAVGACFRELPEPLLTRELYVEFLRSMDLSNKKERLHTLHQLIQRLPEINHCVFERLIFHLARVAQHEHINKMGPNNLAIIFAPCLLQGKRNRRPEELLKDIQKQTECIEIIITEQVEKLTATLRGIHTLNSCATRLNELIDQFQDPQSPESPAPKLPLPALASEKSSQAVQQPSSSSSATASSTTTITTAADGGGGSGTMMVPPSKPSKRQSGTTDEERKRLAHELAQIERERVELTVNLPKLEPFLSDSDEPGDSERSTLSPSPSPSSPFTTLPHPHHREFSPIHEGSEHPGVSWQVGGKTAVSRGEKENEKPTSPTIRINDEDILPDLPSSPTLVPITKNRVSMKVPRRPPSAKHRRSAAVAARTLSQPPFTS